MTLNRRTIILSVFGLLFVIAFFNGCYVRNKMVTLEENANLGWDQVQNVYQRRADLIPNIVATAKKYAEFEKGTLEAVVNARAKATSININPENLDEASLQKFESAQNGLSAALGRLLMVTENYPDLKTSGKFDAIITELEGSENRIAEERRRFNITVKDYNTYIRKFPASAWNALFGFERKAAFKMKQGADTAPDVEGLFDK